MNISTPTSPLRYRRTKGRGSKRNLILFLVLSLILGVSYLSHRAVFNGPASASVRDILLHIEGYPPRDLGLALAAALQGTGDEAERLAGSSGCGDCQ